MFSFTFFNLIQYNSFYPPRQFFLSGFIAFLNWQLRLLTTLNDCGVHKHILAKCVTIELLLYLGVIMFLYLFWLVPATIFLFFFMNDRRRLINASSFQ